MNKLENYDKCVDVIKRLSNDTVSSYICPICGNLFDKESLDNKTLTIDHVPPESIGGKPLVLTCELCNKDLGSKLDSQIKKHKDFEESVKTISTRKGQSTNKVKYKINEYEANAICKMNNSEIRLNFLKKINNPNNITDIRDFFDSQIKSESKDFKFNITPDVRYHMHYFDIALLKTAYLIIFAKLGYTYIFHNNYKLVRNQILKYDKTILKNFIVRLKNDKKGFNLFISESPFKAILIQINDALVVLPTISSQRSFYDNLKTYDIKNITFELTQLTWPKEIELENDYFILKSLKNGKAILKNEAEAS